ncbi:uncharacterized protein LOC142772190 [Rhipicephalus microplus]|uniref:uncharacterized protein LOC142772190 n=1 Tax=Rhipicephalus microplus TaxID=6941 RepID=UPI003F6C4412
MVASVMLCVDGVTAAPPGTTLVTPFTEETVPWYTIGSTTPRAPEYSPSVTPEVGETFPETPFPGAVTENPVEATLFPQQQETSPSMPGASVAATTEVELLSKVATPSTGLVPEFSQSVSPPEFPTAPSSAQQETSHTLPPEVPTIPTTSSTNNVAFPSRPVGVSLPETFPSGVPVFPTTEVSLPSGVPSKPGAIVPTISIAATEPEFVTGTQKEVTATSPFDVSVVPTTQVSLPTGVSGRPSFIPSVFMGVSMPETVTSFPTLVTQKGIPETFPSLVPFVPASPVSLPPSTFSPGMPSLTGGPSVSGTLTGSPTFVSHANASTSFPPGMPVTPTTEVSFPSGAAGGPTLVVPSVSVGVSVPEITGTPPSTGQKESTAMMPSGMFTVPTGEISGPSFLPGISTAVAPSFPAGVSIPGVPTMEAPPLSGIPGQPTAIVPTVSGGFSVPGTKPGSSQPLPHEEFTTRVPSSAPGAPAMEASPPSGVQSQPTAIVPSVTVGVSVPETETSTMPSFPHEEFSTHFPSGPSGIPSTEVPPISGVTSQPTVIAPSVAVGVSVPEGEPGSSQTLPHAEITTPIPSGISGVPITEISPPLDVQSQPTAIVPSLSVGVSVPEGEAGSVPSFPVEEFSTPFPSGPSDIPTTETPPLSGVPSQLTAIVPSVTAGLSWPETEPGSSQTLPHGKVTAPFPLGPSGLPFTEAQLPSSSPAHPAGMVSSVSPGVSEPGTKPGGSHTLPYMPTTELSIPPGVQGQTTAIVPSLSIGVSVPETHTSSVPAFPHGELTSYPTGAPGQLTAVVPSVSVGVSTPESGANTRPSSSEEELTTISPSGPLVTSTEKPTPSGAPGQPPGVVASVSVGASVPESQTITQPSFPLAEFTNPFSTRPSGVPITELPILPAIPGEHTATIPSVSLGVSVPVSQSSSTPSFPYSEFSTSFPPGPSSVPTTRLPMPPGGPGQTTAAIPSVSVGVLMPETPTGSQPSYPQEEFTSQRHSAPSVAPTTKTMPPGVPSQPTVVVPSVSVGVSVPESQTSSPPSSHHFTTTLSPAPPHIPITELPLPSGVPAQPTAIVPSMSVGVSVPEAPTGSQPSYPHREATTPFPSVPTVVPTTETISSGVQGQSTAVVSSVSVGVSVPESQTSRPPSFPYSEFATVFTPGPSGGPATESQMPSGVPGQPTVVIPSVSVGVSEPKAPTGNEPSYPHGEFTSQFPSGPTVIPTTETMPYGVPGKPTAVVPSVSVGVSVPESQTSRPPSFPYTEFTTALPPGPSGVPATESPMPSGVPAQPTAIVPTMSSHRPADHHLSPTLNLRLNHHHDPQVYL